jgi:hypothetical protein
MAIYRAPRVILVLSVAPTYIRIIGALSSINTDEKADSEDVSSSPLLDIGIIVQDLERSAHFDR